MDDKKVTSLREYRRLRAKSSPETTETDALANRPTRAELAADRQRTDYRLRSRVLRGTGAPPPPAYRAARAALEASRTASKGTSSEQPPPPRRA